MKSRGVRGVEEHLPWTALWGIGQLEQKVTVVLDQSIDSVLIHSEGQLELKIGHAGGFDQQGVTLQVSTKGLQATEHKMHTSPR